MPEAVVGLLWLATLGYAIVGVAFAIPFVISWCGWLDPGAKAGSLGFRLAILPGVVALWPFMAVKTLRAMARAWAPPDPEHPVSPARQHLIHGIAMLGIATCLPIVCALALLSRPASNLFPAGRLEPSPLPQVLDLTTPMPDHLPVRASLRTDGARDQIELAVSRAIDEPVVGLYWSPRANPDGLPIEAVFLGSVWGPTRLLFDLPVENHARPGVLTFITLAGDQRILATLPLETR